MKNDNGFTLIEVILGVALMTIIASMIAGFVYTAANSNSVNMKIGAMREDVIGVMDAKVLAAVPEAETVNGAWILSKGGSNIKTISGIVDSDANYNAKSFRTQKSITTTTTTETSTETTTETESTEATTSAPVGSYQKTWNDLKVGDAYNYDYVITDSVKITDSLSTSQDKYIMIDCAGGKNIDIVLEGSLTVNGGSGIFINDDNGNGRVRIFLDGGGQFILNCNWDKNWGVYPLKGSIGVNSCSWSDTGTYVDYSKTLNLYLFTTSTQQIQINYSSCLPGYIIAPYTTVAINVNHEYRYASDGTAVDVSRTNYPAIHGMIVCYDLVLGGSMNQGYFVRYNPPVKAKYAKALADVFVY